MVDSLGYRMKFGVIIPSTSTTVEPEFDAMRPPGVTNHFGRFHVTDAAVHDDEDYRRQRDGVRANLLGAVDQLVTCEPGFLIIGIWAEAPGGGPDGAERMQKLIESRGGVGVAMSSTAARAALEAYGDGIRRLALLTPYRPPGDEALRHFVTGWGYQTVRILGLRCESPILTAQVTTAALRDALLQLDGKDVDAIIQVGSNLAMARLAGQAEVWLGKPVIAINTATYWYALRRHGIRDKVAGFGRLLAEF